MKIKLRRLKNSPLLKVVKNSSLEITKTSTSEGKRFPQMQTEICDVFCWSCVILTPLSNTFCRQNSNVYPWVTLPWFRSEKSKVVRCGNLQVLAILLLFMQYVCNWPSMLCFENVVTFYLFSFCIKPKVILIVSSNFYLDGMLMKLLTLVVITCNIITTQPARNAKRSAKRSVKWN